MNTYTSANQTPTLPLNQRPVQQPRIPCKWDRNRSPIAQVDAKRVVGHGNVFRKGDFSMAEVLIPGLHKLDSVITYQLLNPRDLDARKPATAL